MTVFVVFGCEVMVFSLLLGAYMNSLGLGLAILGGSSLVIYCLFQWLYNLKPFLWVITALGTLTTFFWVSYIDFFFETNFISIFLSIFMGFVIYYTNYLFTKKYLSEML